MSLQKGNKVRLVKSDKTKRHFGYFPESGMAVVGDVLEVSNIRDGYWINATDEKGEEYTYHIEDLDLIVESSTIDLVLEKKQKELEEKRLKVESLGKELSKAQEEYDLLIEEISVLSQANAILKLEGGQ